MTRASSEYATLESLLRVILFQLTPVFNFLEDLPSSNVALLHQSPSSPCCPYLLALIFECSMHVQLTLVIS